MAKKDPTDLSVEERLKVLYQLQTTLSAIDEERALRGELPLEVQDLEGNVLEQAAVSDRDSDFQYIPGTVVSVPDFDENRWSECSTGIHFYITREEAVRHEL